MAVDQTGVYLYSPSDTVNSWHNLLNLGMSSVATVLKDVYGKTVVVASNHSDALSKVSRLKQKGAVFSSSHQALIYRTDVGWFYLYNGSSLTQVPKPVPQVERVTVTPSGGNFTVTNQVLKKYGNVYHLHLNARPTKTHHYSAWQSLIVAQFPAQHAPEHRLYAPLADTGSANFSFYVDSAGKIWIRANANASLNQGEFSLTLSWIK